MDNGEIISVVQEADADYRVGDRVRLLRASDGTSRVLLNNLSSYVDRMDLTLVGIKNPQNLNMILGQSHFIKTVVHRFKHFKLIAILFGCLNQCLNIFWKTRTTITAPGI